MTGCKDVRVLLLVLVGVCALRGCDANSETHDESPPSNSGNPPGDPSPSASPAPSPSSSVVYPLPFSTPPVTSQPEGSTPPLPVSVGNASGPSPPPSVGSNSRAFFIQTITSETAAAYDTILTSPNKMFSFRLKILNQTSCAAVVLHDLSQVAIWITNFDGRTESPGVTECSLHFSLAGLVLFSNTNRSIWSPLAGNSTSTASYLTLNDVGQLSVLNVDNSTSEWTSFDHPTDVLVAGQTLKRDSVLSAARWNGGNSNGSLFVMRVEEHQVALYENFDNLSESVSYFNVSGAVMDASFDYLFLLQGALVVSLRNHSNLTLTSPDSKSDWSYARLTPDGGLSIASYSGNVSTRNLTVNAGDCARPGQCGSYGVCTGANVCTCPPGFKEFDPASPDCVRKVGLSSGLCNQKIVNVSGNTYLGMVDRVANLSTAALCVQTCFGFGNCTGEMALHVKENEIANVGVCYCNLGNSMQTIRFEPNEYPLQTLYLRIVNGSDQTPIIPLPPAKSSRKTAAVAFAAVAGALVVLLIALSVLFLNYEHRRLFGDADNGKYDPAATGLLLSNRQLPPEYTYQEVVLSTGNFAQKLGSGGFSCVYLGHLPDNTKVAVKKLSDCEHKDKEFLEAVTTVGSISHGNLVSLKGYCNEGEHRILVYELVNDGRSLNWYLFPLKSSGFLMNTKTRRSIALGAARGLAHLHKDCDPSSVLHGGVKPENILIDSRMHPRLVDFGLVGLMSRDQRLNEAQMRGSHAYMAPEWAKSQPITEKVDVYSLGIVILELVSGRRCLNQGTSPEKCFLPSWGFSLLRQSEHDPDRLLELADPLLDVTNLPEVDLQVLKGMVYVALWCVQEEASKRPPMKEVVQMLDGNASVATPPYSPALDAFGREMTEGYAGDGAPECSNNSFMLSTSLTRTSDLRLR